MTHDGRINARHGRRKILEESCRMVATLEKIRSKQLAFMPTRWNSRDGNPIDGVRETTNTYTLGD